MFLDEHGRFIPRSPRNELQRGHFLPYRSRMQLSRPRPDILRLSIYRLRKIYDLVYPRITRRCLPTPGEPEAFAYYKLCVYQPRVAKDYITLKKFFETRGHDHITYFLGQEHYL